MDDVVLTDDALFETRNGGLARSMQPFFLGGGGERGCWLMTSIPAAAKRCPTEATMHVPCLLIVLTFSCRGSFVVEAFSLRTPPMNQQHNIRSTIEIQNEP